MIVVVDDADAAHVVDDDHANDTSKGNANGAQARNVLAYDDEVTLPCCLERVVEVRQASG